MKVMFALAERAGHPVEKTHPEMIAAVYVNVHERCLHLWQIGGDEA